MGKKILVALDASVNAMRALEYVAQSFTFEHEITLFSVIPDTAALCEMTGFNTPTLTPYFLKQQGVFCALEDRKKALVKEAINNAESALIDAGFDKKNIKKKMVVEKKGPARAIVTEAKSGYDTVVMGRRGLSAAKEFLLGSVTNKVLSSLHEVSVILVS